MDDETVVALLSEAHSKVDAVHKALWDGECPSRLKRARKILKHVLRDIEAAIEDIDFENLGEA